MELTREVKSLAIVGMCKNAGKTTVLNKLIEYFGNEYILGITSIGRDGESTDLVTSTPKPMIFVPKNTLIATAASLLKNCTCTRQILCSTDIYTSLGEVVIFRALNEGFVELAGPAIAEELVTIKEKMFKTGAQRYYIDGALSRKSLGAAHITDGIILSTGASLDMDMEIVADETAFTCEKYDIKPQDNIKELIVETSVLKYFDKNLNTLEYKNFTLSDAYNYPEIRYIYYPGAFTDSMIKTISDRSTDLSQIIWIAEDSSKILVSKMILNMFWKRKGCLRVLYPTKLLAVTVNPISAYGYQFDKKEFENLIKEKIDYPVVNIRDV